MLNFRMVEKTELNEQKPKPAFYKRVFRFFYFVFLTSILGIIGLITLLLIYEREVKGAILAELNKHLMSEIRIEPDNIDLTIVRSFPYCSIEFRELIMLEALPTKKRDTLLFSKRLSLYFNIKDLFKGKYEIERIKVRDGVLKLRTLKSGKVNYKFWEESPDTLGQATTNFDLNLITIKNCRLIYEDKVSDHNAKVFIQQLEFKGHFKAESYELASKGKVLVHQVLSGKTTVFKNNLCELDLELNVNKNDYLLQKAHLAINHMKLQLSGSFNYDYRLRNVKLRFHAPEPDIATVLSLLPQKYQSRIKDYESEGTFYASGSYHYKEDGSYALKSDFGIKGAIIVYKPSGTKAEEVNMEGQLQYSNLTSLLELKKVHLRLNQDEIMGSCRIRNFENPQLELRADANLDLKNLQNFWPVDTLSKLEGTIKLKAEISGLLSELKEQFFSEKVKVDLNADILGLVMQFKQDEKEYKVPQCTLSVREGNVAVKDLMLQRGESDITFSGSVSGIISYMMDNTSAVTMIGSLRSDRIKMEDLMPKEGSSGGKNKQALIPKNMHFKFDANISKFTLGKFEASAVSGDIEIKDQKAIANSITLETMNGKAVIGAFIDNSNGKLELILESKLEKIDITQLFVQMNNFGQTTLVDKHIRGKGTATVNFSGTWNNDLEINPSSIVANSNLIISNGELINFEPLLQLSKFVEIDDLRRIKFQTLQSTIAIKDGIIHIPKTNVKNSALNIDVWGTHTFNNEIDYHIQLLISELLASKRRKKDSEFGIIEHDPENRRSAYVRMTGTLDNPIIKYDKQGMKEKIKADVEKEKVTVKSILKEEFGFFKKDSLVKKRQEQEPAFELEKLEKKEKKKVLEPKKKDEEDEDF